MNAGRQEPIFESLPNFRDVGGIDIGQGRRTAYGRLYRSQMLRGFSADEVRRLQSIKLARVHDLRGPDEREATPHEYLTDDVPVRAEDAGGSLSAVKITQWRERLMRRDFDETAAHEALKENYQCMPTALGGELAALCQVLAEQPDSPVLIHCSVGKDRTGFITAVLLRAIGVPEESIMEDYLKSGALLADQSEMIQHYRSHLFGQLPEYAEPAFRVMLNTHPEFLEAAYAVIDEEHGGLQTYLESLGITPSMLAAVQAHLTESSGAGE